jgi:capsular exopolysaccharide synthesis family protein
MGNHLQRISEPAGSPAPYAAWLASPAPAEEPGRARHTLRVLRDQRRTIGAVILGVVALVALATALAKPMYESTATVLVRAPKRLLPSAASGIASAVPGLSNLLDMSFDDSVDTQVAILQSDTITEQALDACGLDKNDTSSWDIDVRPSGNASVAEVRARARTPQLAAKLANAVVAAYLALDHKINQESAGQAADFVAGQLKQVEARLNQEERTLRDFKQRSGAVALDSQTKEMVSRFADVEAAYHEALAARAASTAQIGQVHAQLKGVDPSVVASVATVPSPEAKDLRDTITTLETRRAELLQEYLPTSDTVRAVDAQIQDARDRFTKLARQNADTIVDERRETLNPIHQALLQNLAELQGAQLSSQVRSGVLGGLVKQQRDELARLPEKQFELASLMRDAETDENLYTMLTTKHQELQITQESELPNARQLDVAKVKPHPRPVSPRRALNLALAIVLGTVLALMVALTRDQLDDRAKSDGEVAHALGAPVLGHILATKNPPALVSDGPQPSPLGEAYRVLRSNVLLSAVQRPMQTVLITSMAAKEGKSMTAANLAVVLAKQGRSVILVDGDLRRPTLHQRFGVGNERGLSNVLEGTAGVEEVIRETKVANLFLVPSGPAPENPPDLLASEPTLRLIAALKQRADIVIFDSPPSLALSDAQILASRLDGVLLVVDTEVALRRGLTRLREQMDHAGAHVIGAVLSRIDPDRGAFGDTYYHYYRDYLGEERPHRLWPHLFDAARRRLPPAGPPPHDSA